MYDLVIIGGGPAGLTAGIYAVRYGLDIVVLEKNVLPGQIAATDVVENYTGFTAISGPELMQRFKEHAETVGVKIESAEVYSIISDNSKKVVITDKGNFESKTVIIATGANPKKLGIPGEKEFIGKGVSYCATCDAPFYKGKTVMVIGGGESALTDALILSNVVKKVYIIHRRDKLRASKILQERVSKKSNIEIIWNTIAEEIQGKTGVENVVLRDLKRGDLYSIPVDGVFVYIGIQPNTDFVNVKKNNSGFILTNEKLETSVPGIYAAGDCRDTSIWQVVTAVADGAVAAVSAHEYIMDLELGEELHKKNNVDVDNVRRIKMSCKDNLDGISCLKICEDSTADDLQPIAEAIHALLGIPITIRSLNKRGIRMERGEVVDRDYTGPVSEEVLRSNKIIHTVPTEGPYKGKAVVVAPIRTSEKTVIGAVGVVDIVAALDILSMFKEYPGIFDEVETSKKKMQ